MAGKPTTGQIWGGGGSASAKPSTGQIWGGGGNSPASVKTAKEKHGIVGFFDHFASDVRDAAVGLPMGLVNTVEHPIRTAKQTARVEWQTWSPLIHGQFGKFGHDFVQHPLAPILDIAAVASLGLGSAARIAETGSLGARAAELATRNELKVAGATADAPSMTRVLSRRPAARFRQNIVHEVTGRTHPLFSNESLYKKLSSKEGQRWQFAVNARMNQLAKAYKDTNNPAMQRKVFEHMYWQTRDGAARAVKVAHLTGMKPPKGWRFVVENYGGQTAEQIGKSTVKAGPNEVLFETKGGLSVRKVTGFKERAEPRGGTPRAASASQGHAIMEPDGTISVSGGYKHEGGHREVSAPDGHVFVPNGKGGYTLMKKETVTRPDIFDHVKSPTTAGAGDFVKELHNVHSRFTTSDLSKAALQKGGKEVLIVPDRALRAYGTEAANSVSFLRKMYDKPTKVWRAAVLNLRPAYVVNNAVGNTLMFMMNHGDTTGMRAFVDSVKQVKGAKYIDRLDVAGGKTKWMEKHFPDEVGNTFGGSVTNDFQKPGTLNRLGRGVMPANIKMEQMFRRTLINSEMRRMPEVKALMKNGHTFDQAAEKVLKNNPGARARVLEHAHNTLGDYNAMSQMDRHIRDLIPFWAWDKTIARHTAKLVDEQPVKAAIGANLGQQGTQSTENALGAIPSFLKGAIPLPGSLGPSQPGRKSIMTTQGLNPYSTIPDLADTLGSMVGLGNKPAAESVGSLVGPIPTIGIESLTGTRFSGAKIPDKGMGPVGNALRDMVVNLPPSQLAAAATGHLPSSDTINKRTGERGQKLYQKDWESIVSSWLGFPNRKLSPAAAQKLADAEGQTRHNAGMGAI